MQIHEPVSWNRINSGLEKVRQRLLRATRALAREKIDYCVIGGNAVAAWVSRIDESVVRNTKDVDLLVNRQDLETIRLVLEKEGFVYRSVASLGGGRMEAFLDGPDAKIRDAVHLIFANEKVTDDAPEPSPGISSAGEDVADFQLVSLKDLVILKLNSFRDKDRVHLRDLWEVGLIDASWVSQIPDSLKKRLQMILDSPEG